MSTNHARSGRHETFKETVRAYIRRSAPPPEEVSEVEYYIYAEDLVAALIGPFPTKEAAMEHILFCIERGDAATMDIHTAEEVEKATGMQTIDMQLTPEEDRKDKGLLP